MGNDRSETPDGAIPLDDLDGGFTINVGEDVELPPVAMPVEGGSVAPEAETDPPSEPEPASGDGSVEIPGWAIEAATAAVFAYIANRRGDHWQLSEDEAQAIAEPLAAELTELMASIGIGVPTDGISFLTARRIEIGTALAAAIVPRYMRDREIARLAYVVAEGDGGGSRAETFDARSGAPTGHRDLTEPLSMADELARKQREANNE